ncbi:zinc finger protein SHOOT GRAVITROPISM 5-like isoform X2 [Andrographis paniculata]|nr:zinc finger protein SHOOT GRAVITROPISM 5-like isoform X2 [Andrographis paniculata]
MVSNVNPLPILERFPSPENGKRKRRPAGTPDPDAEVVFLSPETLLESDRFVCEICQQGFQRDQNLQMHRRRHKVPWKLLKRETPAARKRVFVCPEPSCLHHDPRHALGDLVGIKKHFRRKHSNQKKWVCQKCSKGYAVESDFKAHLKTCGTRGHSCDCGRVFSRVESFIEHQDACSLGRLRSSGSSCLQPPAASSVGPSAAYAPSAGPVIFPDCRQPPNLELQLLVNGRTTGIDVLGTSTKSTFINGLSQCSPRGRSTAAGENLRPTAAARIVKEQAQELLKLAMTEKACAEAARHQAKWQVELAEQEFSTARRLRQQAQAELEKAQALKQHYSTKQTNSIMEIITCHSCNHKFQETPAAVSWQIMLPEPSSSSSPASKLIGEWEARVA